MKHLIGIDGGGSKTLGYIGNDNGEILCKYKSVGSNYHSVGTTNTKANLQEVIENLCDGAGIGIEEVQVISLGMAGCGRDKDKKVVKKLLSEIGLRNEIILNSDAFTSLIGALGDQRGVVTICGTGSICMGMDPEGRIVRAGGWGHIISDEGSGYSIGQNCLKAMMQSYDGLEKNTTMTERVLDFLGLEREEEIVSYLYHEKRGKEEIAAIAPIVFRCAEEGDEAANRIVKEAAHSLLHLTKTVIEKTRLDKSRIVVALDGGILKNETMVRNLVVEELSGAYEEIDLIRPIYDGGIGAFIIGAKKLNPNFDGSKIKINSCCEG